MKSLIAFTKKEITEQIRSGKLVLLTILFVLLGIMNPAVAKLTPWLLEMFSDSFAESGMEIIEMTVSAMDSWVQFFKNAPMGLLAFILIESSIFTSEYQSGTLVLALTKGLSRSKAFVAKLSVLLGFWTLGYWACFGITYGYNAYFWDNAVAQNLCFSVFCYWIFGIWVIALLGLFSVVFVSNTSVLLGTSGIVFSLMFLGMIPKIKEFLPTFLMEGTSLIYGRAEIRTYFTALIVTAVLTLACLSVSFPIFDKKQL